MVVQLLLVVSGLNMDRGVKLTVVDADIDVQKSDVEGGSFPGEMDGIATQSFLFYC